MRRYWSGLLFFTVSSLALHLAHGQSSTTLVWNNTAGFQSNSNCRVLNDDSKLSDSLRALAENIIEIKDVSPSLEMGEAHFPVIGSFWQAVEENGQLALIECSQGASVQAYLLFDVMIANQMLPVARVAVSSSAALVLQSIEAHTVESAEQVLAQRSNLETGAVRAQALSIAADVDSTEGSLDYVTCISASRLNVRDQTLNSVLFTVGKYETAKPVQSFGTDRVRKTINGQVYYFIKVQFPQASSSQNIGWVADEYIKLRSQCAGAPSGTVTTPPTSAQTWTFPLLKRPTTSYKSGMRAFGASRSGGARLHAAADLYRVDGEAVVSVTSGKVIRDRYYFYEGTYAIEVQHTGGKVVRYGEVKGKSAPNVALGKTLTTGQTVGYIGTVNSGCCKPMLHFEMYAGTKTGALTQSGNKYNRRSDLLNPTTNLSTWEKAKFGVSY